MFLSPDTEEAFTLIRLLVGLMAFLVAAGLLLVMVIMLALVVKFAESEGASPDPDFVWGYSVQRSHGNDTSP